MAPTPAASSACTNTALVTPGCTPAPCSCQAVSSLYATPHTLPSVHHVLSPLLCRPNSYSAFQTHFRGHLSWKAFPDSLCASTERCAFSNPKRCLLISLFVMRLLSDQIPLSSCVFKESSLVLFPLNYFMFEEICLLTFYSNNITSTLLPSYWFPCQY